MQVLITYDIPSKHQEFKQRMFELGYKDSIPGLINCEMIYFPNTTLYHSDKSAVEARDEAKLTAKALGIVLERCVATVWGEWAAVCGEPFK
ncbi:MULTISPECIES: hypothetical protein [Myroides]|uniref:hypothetical protein n=1 Tax=Myroides TaxID=76831 RepID=UPI0008F4F36C|nr:MULTISPECIES: hypothetical protein [Myroides]APA92626.1 hypothetical protein BK054_10425 [Myroides sp. ZB35]MDM1444470.1 hypothetical protein [Myroides odoratimimus]MDM1678003.1 hypothetical protein [Myroides odoratimimus]MEC4076168.1 hypothetical protein [Myroides odoratimimus]